jgi:hypothetical protein
MIQQICDARASAKAARQAPKRNVAAVIKLNQLRTKLDNNKTSSRVLSQMEQDLVPEPIPIKGRPLLSDMNFDCQKGSETLS